LSLAWVVGGKTAEKKRGKKGERLIREAGKDERPGPRRSF